MLLQADLDQYSGEIQGEIYQESPNKQGHLGVTAHPKVMLRIICSAINVVDEPVELLVQLILSSGLILSFFQAFRLDIEGAPNVHRQWEPQGTAPDNFFSTQFYLLTKSPCVVDNIS